MYINNFIFKSSFRSIAKLSGRQRFPVHPLTPHTYVACPLIKTHQYFKDCYSKRARAV